MAVQDEEAAPKLSDIVEHGPVVETPSIAQQLRENAKHARAHKTRDWKIPDYDNLYVTFRALRDYTEVRAKLRDIARKQGLSRAAREIELAVQTLLLASTDSYAMIGDERHDLHVPLGVELYEKIWEPQEDDVRPSTDGEAVHLLFAGDTVQITTLAAEYDLWIKDTSREADDELLGE